MGEARARRIFGRRNEFRRMQWRQLPMPANTASRQQFMSAGFPHLDPLALAGLIALAISAGFVLWLLFVYVSSVMRFVLFDSVIEKHCEIRQGWRRRKSVGFRYFLWQIVYAIAMMAGLVVLVGVPAVVAFAAGWFNRPKEHIIPLVLGGLLMFFALLAFVVLSVIVHVLTKDFVVPQMALENIGALDGWRRSANAEIGKRRLCRISRNETGPGDWRSRNGWYPRRCSDPDHPHSGGRRWRHRCSGWQSRGIAVGRVHHHCRGCRRLHCPCGLVVLDFSGVSARYCLLSGVLNPFLCLTIFAARSTATSGSTSFAAPVVTSR